MTFLFEGGVATDSDKTTQRVTVTDAVAVIA